jgi:hypothetical protein
MATESLNKVEIFTRFEDVGGILKEKVESLKETKPLMFIPELLLIPKPLYDHPRKTPFEGNMVS